MHRSASTEAPVRQHSGVLLSTKRRRKESSRAIQTPDAVIDPLSGGVAAAGLAITLAEKAVSHLRPGKPLTGAIIDSTGEGSRRLLDLVLTNRCEQGIYIKHLSMVHPKVEVEVDFPRTQGIGGSFGEDVLKRDHILLPKHLSPAASLRVLARFDMPSGVKHPHKGKLLVRYDKLDDHDEGRLEIDVLLRADSEVPDR